MSCPPLNPQNNTPPTIVDYITKSLPFLSNEINKIRQKIKDQKIYRRNGGRIYDSLILGDYKDPRCLTQKITEYIVAEHITEIESIYYGEIPDIIERLRGVVEREFAAQEYPFTYSMRLELAQLLVESLKTEPELDMEEISERLGQLGCSTGECSIFYRRRSEVRNNNLIAKLEEEVKRRIENLNALEEYDIINDEDGLPEGLVEIANSNPLVGGMMRDALEGYYSGIEEQPPEIVNGFTPEGKAEYEALLYFKKIAQEFEGLGKGFGVKCFYEIPELISDLEDEEYKLKFIVTTNNGQYITPVDDECLCYQISDGKVYALYSEFSYGYNHPPEEWITKREVPFVSILQKYQNMDVK